MNNFEEMFVEMAKHDDAYNIFNNLLNFIISSHCFNGTDASVPIREYLELYRLFIGAVEEKLETHDWCDYLGEFYENIIQSKFKAGDKGQFFTAPSVCDLMTELNHTGEGVVNDPTCGSGRLLLAKHICEPALVKIGQDLDEMACKMCVVNFLTHGVQGSVVWGDTLQGEIFKCWKVNEHLYNGVPVPHVELVTPEEAYNWRGV